MLLGRCVFGFMPHNTALCQHHLCAQRAGLAQGTRSREWGPRAWPRGSPTRRLPRRDPSDAIDAFARRRTATERTSGKPGQGGRGAAAVCSRRDSKSTGTSRRPLRSVWWSGVSPRLALRRTVGPTRRAARRRGGRETLYSRPPPEDGRRQTRSGGDDGSPRRARSRRGRPGPVRTRVRRGTTRCGDRKGAERRVGSPSATQPSTGSSRPGVDSPGRRARNGISRQAGSSNPCCRRTGARINGRLIRGSHHAEGERSADRVRPRRGSQRDASSCASDFASLSSDSRPGSVTVNCRRPRASSSMHRVSRLRSSSTT